jgi:hypothetical protein
VFSKTKYKMKAIIVIAIMLWSTANVFAQNTIYFNKTFKPDSLNTLSPAILTLQDGYLVAHTYNAISGNEGFGLRKLNYLGETQWFKNLSYGIATHTMIGGGVLIKTLDNNYMLTSAITQNATDEDYDIILFKFNENGDTLWTKKVTNPSKVDYAYNIVATSDNGYIMAGVQRNFAQNNRLFVLKTDSLGNEEWSKQYHPLQHGTAFSIFETDTGYVVSGYMQYPDTDHDMFIMEIDKQGEVVWEKNYGGEESDNACLVLPNNDGYFLIGATEQGTITMPFVARLNQIGDTLWSRTINESIISVQEAPMQPTSDGGFVCLYGYPTELGYDAPWFWRFTATGDTLWTRRIPGAPSNNNTYLKDIAPTHDGGWVLSGFNYSEQSSWAVKLDSLGHTCSYLGCDSTATVIDNINIPPLSGQVFTLTPNPATTQATLYIAQPAAGRQLRIYNMSGQQVKHLVLPDYIAQYHFSVADLPAGVYVCKVGDALGQKLVVGK